MIRLPFNPKNNALVETLQGFSPTIFGSFFRNGRRLQMPQLAGFLCTEQSKSSVCRLSSEQMTTIHRVLKLALHWAILRFRITPASILFFFEPFGNGVSGDAERASQSAQRGAFLVSSQDLLAFFWRVTIWLRIISTHPSAIAA